MKTHRDRLPFRVLPLAAALALAVTTVPAGAFKAKAYPSWEEDGVSQTLNLFTFYEESDQLRVFVGTEIMRFHDDETYFPLQIAIGNGASKAVRITPDEFVLTDDKGVYYPLAATEELLQEYNKSTFDRNLLSKSQFLGNKFVGFDQIPSLFYPNISFTGVKNDRIELPKGTYLSDVLYFRKPLGPLQERTFTLTVYFPQLERQMDVKFVLPGKAKDPAVD